MSNLTPAARTVKPSRRAEKVWHATISKPEGGVCALCLTSTEGGKVERFGYYLSAIPSDIGRAFHLVKFADQVKPGEPGEYDVLLAGTLSQCECRGWLRWGHRGPCKHLRELAKLLAEGLLPDAPCHCGKRPAVVSGECLPCSDAAADAIARRHDLDACDDL
jgi:hypothetical protein